MSTDEEGEESLRAAFSRIQELEAQLENAAVMIMRYQDRVRELEAYIGRVYGGAGGLSSGVKH